MCFLAFLPAHVDLAQRLASGGPWRCVEYLAIMRNPKHKDHKDMLEWRGPFDPEGFDAKEATTAMRKVKKGD